MYFLKVGSDESFYKPMPRSKLCQYYYEIKLPNSDKDDAMARLPRLCPKGHPQHIIQRGNNRQPCFAIDDDFASYACWLKEYATEFDIKSRRSCETGVR